MKNIFVIGFCLLLLGCEKDINLKLDTTSPELVVEGTIENGRPPVIILSSSVGYFSTISATALEESFVHNADVYVSNGNLTHKLREYNVPLSGGMKYYYYTTDSANLSTSFVGELNHSYSLKIVANGKEYISSTTIPNITKRLDSLWVKPAPTNDSTEVMPMMRVTDPPGYGDYIRYFTKVNRGLFLPPMYSAYDDLFIDGTTYELPFDLGIDKNAANKKEHNYLKRGDTLEVKLCNIDKATFDFWRTMDYSSSAIGNPFATPTKVLGNISNNALGYFGGYAAQYRTLYVPK